jgi:hypothetical protein
VPDDLLDAFAINRLQAAYGDIVTRRAWDELVPLFVDDAPVRVDTVTRPVVELVGPREIGEFIATAVERFELFEFVVLNAVAQVVADGQATGRVWIAEIRQERGGGQWSTALGLYADEYRRVDGSWRFAARRYRSIARRASDLRAEVLGIPSG